MLLYVFATLYAFKRLLLSVGRFQVLCALLVTIMYHTLIRIASTNLRFYVDLCKLYKNSVVSLCNLSNSVCLCRLVSGLVVCCGLLWSYNTL